ncbi:MAG TPA: metal ABC transporter permease [Solirubrobacteraceae bacterium]|nr:metal ABC transporter permease [Solirubrobacteraceae bacterium]
MTILLEPFEFEFFRNGLIVATVAGGLCGFVGVFVVLRGMSYIGHGLSHSIFGGAVAGYALSIDFYVGAGVWGFLSALLIGHVARRRSIGADAAIGVITTASFAAGLAVISRHHSFTQNFEAALFGNVLGVTSTDIAVVTAVTALAGVVVLFSYRRLLFTTFDAAVADVFGVRSSVADALLSLMLAAAIIATIRILGVTLVAAALVIPPVIARMLTTSFSRMLGISAAIGAVTGFVGMNLSYHLDVSSGATIVLVAAAAFGAVFAATGSGSRRLRCSG